MLKQWLWILVPSGFFAVDSFFFLSGFLCVFTMVKKFNESSTTSLKTALYVIVYRYYRLVVPLIFLILFASNIFPYLMTGPNSSKASKGIDWSYNTGCQK